jgi:membrane-associated protein
VQEYLQPLLDLLHAETVVKAGYVLMTVIVFVETGLLIGFCLPGDSLLVTAGIFAARGDLNIWWINGLLIPAAILGDTLGYWIGYHAGGRLFQKEASLLFKPKHLQAAHDYYERHGGKTIVIARFMPIIRTFAPVVAGMGRMDYRRFLMFNVVGGVAWIVSLSLTGYFLGVLFPGAVKRLEIIIVVVVFISVLPAIIHYLRHMLKGRPESFVEALADPEILDEPAPLA